MAVAPKGRENGNADESKRIPDKIFRITRKQLQEAKKARP